jgi:hypothetical protein
VRGYRRCSVRPAHRQMPRPPAAPRADIGANWTVIRSAVIPNLSSRRTAGVSTYIGFYPDQKVGVVVLAIPPLPPAGS